MQIHDNLGNIIDDLNPFPIKEVDSTIVKPVKIDSHTAVTIQTHNAVSVPLSNFSTQASWMDCDGYDKLAITVLNDASTNFRAAVFWSHDGVNQQGFSSNVIPTSANGKDSGIIDTRARYAKVIVYNDDAGLAHTVSAWAYLKA